MNNCCEIQYAVKHKPTKKWCLFANDEIELNIITMKLVDFNDSTIMKSKDKLIFFLKSAFYGKTTNYGTHNFLEFEIINVKVSYSIEEKAKGKSL
jgi:hypothetical protein